MAQLLQALLKLTLFLAALPFLATLLHLRFLTHRNNLAFVGPVHVLHGIHTFSAPTKKNYMNVDAFYGIWQGFMSHTDNYLFFKVVKRATVRGTAPTMSWPSITTIATTITNSISTDDSMLVQPLLRYNSIDQNWCLSNGDLILCSKLNSGNKVSPPSGIWAQDHMSNMSVRLSHYGPMNDKQKSNSSSRPNRNLEQIMTRPSTTLLLAINIALAYFYWNRRISPAEVSKIYHKIIHDHEIWRCFTGATAHFEPLHLAFNMTALYSLGTELEPSFGSIPFLFYNISLIPITSIIMMTMIHVQIKLTGNTALAETSTVGYSGILFAWMVIVSLERQQTCPIPFLDDVCFETHDFMGFKWNASPIVQLIVAQCIMGRVSFVGHLAGIVAGFLLHWHVLPLELVQPSVILPVLYMIHLWWIRGFIPIRGTTENPAELIPLDVAEQGDGPRFDARRVKRERDQSMQVLLARASIALCLCVIVVMTTMNISIIIGFALQASCFYFCKQAHAQTTSMSHSIHVVRETIRLGVLWKVYILTTILTVVTNSMTLAGWAITGDYWHGTHVILDYLPATILLCVVTCVQLFCLSLACTLLDGIGQNGSGVFFHVFGHTVLGNAKVLGHAVVTMLVKNASRTAFEGRGITLGSRDASSDQVGSLAL